MSSSMFILSWAIKLKKQLNHLSSLSPNRNPFIEILLSYHATIIDWMVSSVFFLFESLFYGIALN